MCLFNRCESQRSRNGISDPYHGPDTVHWQGGDDLVRRRYEQWAVSQSNLNSELLNKLKLRCCLRAGRPGRRVRVRR